jgi:hypothetical protein
MQTTALFFHDGLSNKSMDVRAKQRLCFNDSSFVSACVILVSPYINSTVCYFVVKFVIRPFRR